MYRPLLLSMNIYYVMVLSFANNISGASPTASNEVCVSNGEDSTDLVSGPNGIDDASITASSAYPGYEQYHARLNNSRAWGTLTCCEIGSYIQFKFPTVKCFTEIRTQGFLYEGVDVEYVKNFTLMTSTDCSTFTEYQNFPGNVDADSLAINTFSAPVRALCVRVVVLEYEIWVALRVGLMGYDPEIQDD